MTTVGPKSAFIHLGAWLSCRVAMAHITARILVHRQLVKYFHYWAVSQYASIPGYLEIPKV